MRAEFELHPLAVEDAVKAHQRSKLERYGDCLFLVFKTARYDDAGRGRSSSAEIQLFAGDGFVITVRHGEASALSPVRNELESEPERMALGPIAVVHAILDRVVDDYRPVLDGLDNDIAEIEAEVFSPDRTNPAERIYKLKRQVLDLYRNVEPLARAAGAPAGRASTRSAQRPRPRPITSATSTTTCARRWPAIEIQRELLSEVLDVNLTHVSVQQNEDMRPHLGMGRHRRRCRRCWPGSGA